jgi:acetyl-CoA synthetase
MNNYGLSLTSDKYHSLYKASIESPTSFWEKQANEFLEWFQKWDEVLQGDFAHQNVRWFKGGKLNASYNCIDRHLATRGEKIAINWESNSGEESKKITYQELYNQVSRLANVLRKHGIQKGDRVCIYLPMIPEALYAMLACARIGAIHSVVFAGFSAEALKIRILNAKCNLLITADESLRGDKTTPLKSFADQALLECPQVKSTLVVKRTGNPISWQEGRDHWYESEIAQVEEFCESEVMDATDPLFILYTSGSTGKPKGVVHGTGGYLLYSAITHKYIFNYQEEDVYWCTADIGWITGHSYLLYGPLVNGATIVLFEGVPQYPTHSRMWEIIDKYKVNIFYTAPTAIRALRKEGNEWVEKTQRESLRILGTVGEPINPEVWDWYYTVVGNKKCVIVDTWWQTETGGILFSPIPGATPSIPGSVTSPFLEFYQH